MPPTCLRYLSILLAGLASAGAPAAEREPADRAGSVPPRFALEARIEPAATDARYALAANPSATAAGPRFSLASSTEKGAPGCVASGAIFSDGFEN